MLRLLIYGVAGSPTVELAESISDFYDLGFIYIENTPAEDSDYFSDTIPEVTFDTGDYSSGSAHQQYFRDPASVDYDKQMDRITSVINTEKDCLSSEDLSIIFRMKQGVIVSEIPDLNLIRWATHIIYLYAKEDSAVDWFSKRLKCPSCGNVHHLDDKPPVEFGICDRCGTDLIKLESDQPKFVRKQYENWENYFWKFREHAKDAGNYKVYNVDKFDTFDALLRDIDRQVQDSIEQENWYNFLNDSTDLGLSPLDGPFVWNPLSQKFEPKPLGK